MVVKISVPGRVNSLTLRPVLQRSLRVVSERGVQPTLLIATALVL